MLGGYPAGGALIERAKNKTRNLRSKFQLAPQPRIIDGFTICGIVRSGCNDTVVDNDLYDQVKIALVGWRAKYLMDSQKRQKLMVAKQIAKLTIGKT